jgi:hypothetical protein
LAVDREGVAARLAVLEEDLRLLEGFVDLDLAASAPLVSGGSRKIL